MEWTLQFRNQLKAALKAHLDKQEHIVRQELKFYENTHREELSATLKLFYLNMISHQERL